ncbi:MAG: glycosyltransferase family 2 protein [Bacteroidales bacterium]|nr:glycosyltransferase family 2 protein [Bacteroidales bacterium]
MKVALVILNWNGERLLKEYLPTVLEHCGNGFTDVIVADNCSTDASMQVMATEFADVRTIVLDKNYGFAEGYNRALAQLEGYDYYVLCNSDVMLKSDAVSPVVKMMEGDKDIAVAVPKIKSLRQPEMFEYAGAAGGFIDKYGFPFCRGRILQTVEADNGQYEQDGEIFWASGACMVVRECVYKSLGGLDAAFFAHMEEIDFCWRVKNSGLKVVFCHDAEVFHLGGATLNQGSPRKLFLNYRNSLWMMAKNLPKSCLIFRIWARMVLDGMSAMVYLLQLKPKFFWAVVRAHFAFYGNIPRLARQRKELPKASQKIPAGMLDGSIVWRYYINKCKTFDKLWQKTKR